MFLLLFSCILLDMDKRKLQKTISNIRRKIQRHRNDRRRNRDVYVGRSKTVLIWTVEILAVICAAFLLVCAFGMRVTCNSVSMEPGIANGQQVLINRMAYVFGDPKANDVVLFQPRESLNGEPTIKRIIGVPGDTIIISGGKLYVNGTQYQDPVPTERMEYSGRAKTAITLGEGEYFVLGDNRNNSEDSRYQSIGNITKEEIIGKIWFSASLSKLGAIE